MTNFSEKIIGKIQEQEMKPLSHWYFRLKNFVFWGTFLLAVFLGTIAFSMLLVSILGTDFEIFPHDISFHKWMIVGHLSVWFLVFSLFVGIAYFGALHTKTGYRIAPWKWILGNFLLTIFLGSVVFAVSNDPMRKNMEEFSGMRKEQEKFWNRPEEGFLMGFIEKKDEIFFLTDASEKKWELSFQLQNEEDKEHLDMMNAHKKMPPHPMRFFGKQENDHVFVVEKMMPPDRGKWRKKKEE